jgi:hypothetical protein
VTATRYMVTNELGTERDNKKAAGIKGGWHVKPYPLRRFGLSPRLLICLHGGVADLPSECPFGAERGTERTALCRTFLRSSLSALRRATSTWRRSWVGLGSGLWADQGEVVRRGSATAMPADAAAGRPVTDQACNDKQG